MLSNMGFEMRGFREFLIGKIGPERATALAKKIFQLRDRLLTHYGSLYFHRWNRASANLKGVKRFRIRSSGLSVPSNGKYFVTFKVRPTITPETHPKWLPSDLTECAIVVQGGIETRSDFTHETVKLYARNFPNAKIILSTWDDTDGELLRSFKNAGVHLVLSRKPSISGIGNSNLQTISSHAGLLKAKQLGFEFALKTRTDQRFFNPRTLSLFKASLMSNPLTTEQSTCQINRLVTLSFCSLAYRMYGLTDMLQFGNVEDLLEYWPGELDSRNVDSIGGIPAHTLRGLAQQNIVETYFCSNFLSRTGWPLKWTLSDYWMAVRERFFIVDSASIDFFWPKYSSREDRWRIYSEAPSHQEIDSAFWHSLLNGMEAPEKFLDMDQLSLGPLPNRESPL